MKEALIKLGGLSLAAVGLVSCAHTAQANPPERTAVNIAVAAQPPQRAAFSGTGAVIAAHTYNVAFEIAGRVRSVGYDVGDRVERGAVLASLEANDQTIALRAAQARLLGAAATAQKTDGGSRVQERASASDALATARAVVDQARAALALASSNARRADVLFADGDIAAQAHDQTVAAERDAQSRLVAAQAQAASAQAQRSLVDEGARREDRATAHAEELGARAAVDAAASSLAKTAIVAPATSFVLTRTIEPGSEASPATAAFTLTDAAAPDVIVAVPENALPNVHVGTRARIHDLAGDVAGSVLRIEPAADPTTRTANVRIRVHALRARPGAVIAVTLGESRSGGAVIPLGAISTDASGSGVFVYDPATQRVLRRRVIVRRAEGDEAIVADLAPGTQVVSLGEHLVHSGDRVRVVSAIGGTHE